MFEPKPLPEGIDLRGLHVYRAKCQATKTVYFVNQNPAVSRQDALYHFEEALKAGDSDSSDVTEIVEMVSGEFSREYEHLESVAVGGHSVHLGPLVKAIEAYRAQEKKEPPTRKVLAEMCVSVEAFKKDDVDYLAFESYTAPSLLSYAGDTYRFVERVGPRAIYKICGH